MREVLLSATDDYPRAIINGIIASGIVAVREVLLSATDDYPRAIINGIIASGIGDVRRVLFGTGLTEVQQ